MLFLTRTSIGAVVAGRQCSCVLARWYSQQQTTTTTAGGHSPLDVLDDKISRSEIQPDDHQRRVTAALQTVYDSIQGYSPPKASGGLGKWFSFGKREPKVQAPKGLYIYGSVGGGKTMLMDMFYDCCSVSLMGKGVGGMGGWDR